MSTTKKKPIAPAVPPTPEPVVPPAILIARSDPLNKIIHTMRNGASAQAVTSGVRFPAHSGLVAQILAAYNRRDAGAFVSGVQTYLQQAVGHIPQAGRVEDIPDRIAALRMLIEQAGLEPVGRRLLSVINAPL